MTIMAKVIETNDSEESSLSGNEASDEEAETLDEGTSTMNAGWVDSIAKILKTNKPKGKKTLVLSKAKKLTDLKTQKVKPAGFQVATTEGEIREEKVEIEEDNTDQPPRKKKRELPDLRVKPNILEKDRERTLTKIATRGVVQLFNAVKMQQKDISKKLEEAGPLEVRKEKALQKIDKRAFLDVLMGEKSQIVDDVREKHKKEVNTESGNKTQSTWSVLRDDFMMGAKLKDWDKELETEMEVEKEAEMESN